MDRKISIWRRAPNETTFMVIIQFDGQNLTMPRAIIGIGDCKCGSTRLHRNRQMCCFENKLRHSQRHNPLARNRKFARLPGGISEDGRSSCDFIWVLSELSKCLISRYTMHAQWKNEPMLYRNYKKYVNRKILIGSILAELSRANRSAQRNTMGKKMW